MEPPSGYGEPRQRSSHAGPGPSPELNDQFTNMMWEAGSKHLKDTFKDTFTSYGKIDYFRPYFDVEVHQVRRRLLRSFIPRKPSQISTVSDLYGPSMVLLTMVALLLLSMKTSGFVVPNGTLMGTSFFTCFGSWLFFSGALYILCFLLAADIPMLLLVSVFGYSLTSHCVVLLLTALLHTSHDHLYFFILVGVFCIPSAIRLGLFVCSHARNPFHRLLLIGTSVAIHVLLIMYFHFGFHVVVEEIDSMIESGEDPTSIGSSS